MLSSCGAHSAWLLAVLLAEGEPFPAVAAALGARAVVAVPPVLPGLGEAEGVDLGAAEHAGEGEDGGLIEVGLVLERVQRRAVDDDRILRRQLAQPAHRPGVVGANLVVEADHRVPVVAVLDDRVVERRPGREDPGAVRLVDLALEADEEVGLVPDDWPAQHEAPLALLDFGLRQPALVGEVVLFGQGVARHVAEHHARELVGAALGHGVDDRPAGAPVLGLVHARDHFELLNRLERRAYLGAGAGAQGVVAVVAAVDRHVVVLVRLPVRDDGVVAHLRGRRELHAGQQGDGGEVVAVHRRQFGQLAGADVAADVGGGEVDERAGAGDGHRLLKGANGHREIHGHRGADGEHQAGPLEGAEALERGDDAVAARHHGGEMVDAFGAGRGLAELPTVFVGDDDGDAGEGGPLFIESAAGDLRRPLLGERRAHRARQGEGRDSRRR